MEQTRVIYRSQKNKREGGAIVILTALHLEVTSRCNFQCEFCTPKDQRTNADADFDNCVEVMEKLKDISVHGVWTNMIQINGESETLLYSRLPDVIRESKKRFASVEFITNCYLLTEKKLMKFSIPALMKFL